MKKRTKPWLVVAGVLLLIILSGLGLILRRFFQSNLRFETRPLVLIHAPSQSEDYQVGDGVLVHATAREDRGLARIELWVNGLLVDSLDADQPYPTNLTLASAWVPTYQGEQQLVVRAFAASGTAGQSSLRLRVSQAGPDQTGIHLVEEGETLESIAAASGSTLEEVASLNPGLDPGGIGPGDEVIVPDSEPESGPGGPSSDEGGPLYEGEAPLLGYMWGLLGLFSSEEDGEVLLRLELPSLRTGTGFDGLHCYLSLAGSLPQWYPDLDRDQATDESFAAGDGGWWNTENILVGDAAPMISWPADQPLPLTVSCVGITGGGTEAVELGQISLEIPPEEWDGNPQPYSTSGEGGELFFETRITQLSGVPRYVPKTPDPDMPVPYNLRLNRQNRTLEWDYDPDLEDPINGFMIYLNGNLQWNEPADARETRLPPEWFNPPCASIYTFEVYAFIVDFPEGRESDPGSVELEQPREGCVKQIRVTFLTLETFDLGGDGRYEDRHGDVGPAYGSFFANDKRVSFDHGREGRGLDMPNGLRHNSSYDLAAAAEDVSWHFNAANSLVTEVPTGGTLRVGYIIQDRDTGRCRDSDDPGCDDLICRGENLPIRDQYGELDGVNTATITSDNGRCRVTFEYQPTEDSPTGDRGAGGEPLPWLEIVALDVYSNPDETIVAVRNAGSASWPGRTLTLELLTRDGRSLGHSVFEDVDLPVGEFQTFHIPRTTPGPLIDVCVLVDSMDEVLELYERSGSLYHHPFCTDLPDLVIREVVYSDADGRKLRVFVDNIGEGPVANWPVDINIELADGSLLYDSYRFPEVTLAGGRSHTFEIQIWDDAERRSMFEGYLVTINPDQAFPESDLDNNSFSIPEGTQLALSLYGIEAPEGLKDIVEFHVDAYIRQGSVRSEQIVDWNITQDIDWGSCFHDRYCVRHFSDYEYYSHDYDIFGDESLELVINITHPGSLWENFLVTEYFDGPTWAAGGDSPSGGCNYWPMRDDVGAHRFYFTHSSGNDWFIRVDICRENYSD